MHGDLVLVLPPLWTVGAPFDFRVQGVTYWLGQKLAELGLPGASGVMTRQVSATKELIGTEPPADADIRAKLIEAGAKHGLLLSFAVLSTGPTLALARLFEVRRGLPLRTIGRWRFEDPSAHLATDAFALLDAVATRLGANVSFTDWSDAFGTNSLTVAGSWLTALGGLAIIEQGLALEHQASGALEALEHAIAGRVPQAIQVLPHYFAALRRAHSADDILLTASLHRALAHVGEPPANWQPELARYGVAPKLLD